MSQSPYTYRQVHCMEQIETCHMDKSIEEPQRNLMLIGLFLLCELAFDAEVVQIHMVDGPIVTNPLRLEEAKDVDNLISLTDATDEDEDDNDETQPIDD